MCNTYALKLHQFDSRNKKIRKLMSIKITCYAIRNREFRGNTKGGDIHYNIDNSHESNVEREGYINSRGNNLKKPEQL